MIRVLIVDDHEIVRTGLERLLQGWPSVEVVATASNGREAIELAERHRPDVVLMDVSMPVMGGLEATRRILADRPQTQVVVLTSFDDQRTVGEALDSGAIGYLLKDADPATLREGIELAARGESPINPRVARTMLAARRDRRAEPAITDREREILELLRQGLSNKEIAAGLGITVKTVKAHLSSLFQKIGVLDRTQAALWAERFAPERPAPGRE
ncbi:MAG: response regulator transcription factor [Chloroflexi bacterium]|nr:response regulator transcription factor [Chloroflexota bacterium]